MTFLFVLVLLVIPHIACNKCEGKCYSENTVEKKSFPNKIVKLIQGKEATIVTRFEENDSEMNSYCIKKKIVNRMVTILIMIGRRGVDKVL